MTGPFSVVGRSRQRPATRGIRLLAPLRNRSFALLWGGMTVSLLGDGIYFLAITWEALRLSNTTIAISLAGIAWMLPTVVLLVIGGSLSDRYDRRLLMIWTSMVQALAIGAIGLLVLLGALRLWTMLLLVAAYGAADAFFLPSFEAIVPMLVEPDELTQASAVEQFVRPLALQLAGPAIGGIVIAVAGTATAFLADAATFLIGSCALTMMRVPRPPARGGQGAWGALRGMSEAVGFVRANAWLWRTLVAAGLTLLLFVGPSQVLLPYVVKNVLHAGSGTLGAIRGCGGVGALFAALAVSQRGLPGWPVRAMLTGWALQCLTLCVYALAGDAWLFAGVSLIGGACGAAGSVVWGTLMKTQVPNELLGRVASLDLLVSIGLVPVSFAITGPVSEVLGASATLLGGGVLAAATMIVFALASPSRPTTESSRGRVAIAAGERLAVRRRDPAVAAAPTRSTV